VVLQKTHENNPGAEITMVLCSHMPMHANGLNYTCMRQC